MHNPLTEILKQKAPLILDGALATELEKRGCDLTDALWSAKILINNPELIYQVHYDYFAKGADCAITASYQATPQGFAAIGLDNAQALSLIKKSAELALKAKNDFIKNTSYTGSLLVAGSIGPYGAFLADGSEYTGDYSLSSGKMMQFHYPRMKALQEAGVDIFAIETQPSFEEIKSLSKLLEKFPQSSAWVSCTLRDVNHISDGTPLKKVAQFLDNQNQIVALGLNCVAVEKVTPALEQIKLNTNKPLIVYPNSGEHYDASTKTWHSAASGCAISDKLSEWQELGVQLIGGCCRTTPQDINLIARHFN